MRDAVEDATLRVSRRQLRDDAFGLRGIAPAGSVVVLRASRAITVAAALESLQGWAREVHLVGATLPGAPPDEAVVISDEVLDAGTPEPGTPEAPARQTAADATGLETRWTLYTSGTTGSPKPVTHTLASLTRTVRTDGRAPDLTWGLLYDPTRMSGIQVVLQALGSGSRLVDPRHVSSLPDRVALLASRGVDALSATPTLWRQILQTPATDGLRLRQITLGGEIADQRVLDGLRRAFPDARLTHVFASTETGAAFSVGDGREGFPAAYLTDPPRGVRLAVRDGVLHVHSPGASAAGPDGFASTGDVVEVRDDRVLFRGRQSGVVNVGGVKVWPEEVESVLRSHPAVADAVVATRSNPFSGQILVASVVPARQVEPKELARTLRAYCSERLSSAHVPATVRVVDELALSATGKATRR